MDLSHIAIPNNIAAWVGAVCLMLLWKAVGIWLTDYMRSKQFRRRIGNRANDDAKGITGLEWYDRLIAAMNANGEVNQRVAESLVVLSGRQDAILEAFRLTQMEQRETNERIRSVVQIIEHRLPEGA